MTWRWTMMVGGVALGVAAAALADESWWAALGPRAEAEHTSAQRASPFANPSAASTTPPANEATGAKTPIAPPSTSTQSLVKQPTSTLPLAPSHAARVQRKAASQSLDWDALTNTGASLGIVLAVLTAMVWVLRRTGPKSASPLPKEVFEVLGRAPLASRQQAHLVRCGRKLLLVAMTPGGAETLTEITDPEEVDHLAGLCQASRDGSSTGAFQSVLAQFERDPRAAVELSATDQHELQRQEHRRHGANRPEVRRA